MALSILCISVSAFICLLAPTIIAVVMIAKRRASIKSFVVGAAVFGLMQLLLRIPLLGELQNQAWFSLFTVTHTLVYALLLAFSAGLFEEVGRYFGTRWFLKEKYLTWNNAVVFGLGHGGIEAFALAGIPYASILIDAVAGRNIALLWNTPASGFLLGGIERTLAVVLHIGFTMLVFYAVKNRRIIYLVYALLAHTLVDFILPLLKQMGVSLSVWGMEGVLAVLTAAAVVVIIKFRAPLKTPPENGGILNEK